VALKRHKFSIWEKFIETLKSNMLDVHVLERLRNKFDSLFKYDAKGIPRVWKSGDELDPIFTSARDEVCRMMI
jgi:hypothetical protein